MDVMNRRDLYKLNVKYQPHKTYYIQLYVLMSMENYQHHYVEHVQKNNVKMLRTMRNVIIQLSKDVFMDFLMKSN